MDPERVAAAARRSDRQQRYQPNTDLAGRDSPGRRRHVAAGLHQLVAGRAEEHRDALRRGLGIAARQIGVANAARIGFRFLQGHRQDHTIIRVDDEAAAVRFGHSYDMAIEFRRCGLERLGH